MEIKRFTEPASLREYKEPQGSKRTLYAVLVVALVFAIGIVSALSMGRLVPTYNGSINVEDLQNDPSNYDLSEADGVAYVIITQNLEKTNGENVCYSVVYNFRGYDTMGESFILIAAVAGCICILRTSKKTAPAKEAVETKGERNLITKASANILLPLACTFGGYVILHGDSSPGGGFQGGVLVSAVVLLVYLAYGRKGMAKLFNSGFLHESETAAEVIYIVIGLFNVFVGAAFATNHVLSSIGMETALFMNDAVGYHVMCGVSFLLIALLSILNVEEVE